MARAMSGPTRLAYLLATVVLAGAATAPVAQPISPASVRQSDKAAERASAALKANKREEAIRFAEQAVLYGPSSAAHRTVLGQAYLQAGRFQSAETAFRDALRLEPGRGSAALGLALSQIALNQNDEARETLRTADTAIALSDLGLALALAGDREGSVELLERGARSSDASAQIRQNLALAYVLAGRWAEAQTTASQDLAPHEVGQRMLQWAQMARPRGSADQVAALLGTRPAHDPGMPVQLALIEELPATTQPVQAAEAAPVPVIHEAPPAPVRVIAVAPPAPAPVIAKASPAPVPVIAPAAPVVASPVLAPVRLVALPAPAVSSSRPASFVRPTARGYVVQLGAYAKLSRLDQAWAHAVRHTPSLASFSPVSSTARGTRSTLYRLSASGFATRMDAVRLCGRIKAKGGDCFVRGPADESPLLMARAAATRQYAAR